MRGMRSPRRHATGNRRQERASYAQVETISLVVAVAALFFGLLAVAFLISTRHWHITRNLAISGLPAIASIAAGIISIALRRRAKSVLRTDEMLPRFERIVSAVNSSAATEGGLLGLPFLAVVDGTEVGRAAEATTIELSARSGLTILVGPAGSGKTYFLRELASRLQKHLSTSDAIAKVFLLDAGTWRVGLSLRSWLIEEIKRTYGAPPYATKHWLINQLVLLVDSVDALSPGSRYGFINEVISFLDENPGNSILLASRDVIHDHLQSSRRSGVRTIVLTTLPVVDIRRVSVVLCRYAFSQIEQ